MGMTARFKCQSCFIVETVKTDFTGPRTFTKIVHPMPEVDFSIANYIEYNHHYDIIVSEKDPNFMDSGEIVSIINVPKNMITIANKHLKENPNGSTSVL
jgi:hypothetical protein